MNECVLFISGSRVFTEQKIFDEDMKEVISRTQVIHGGAKGVDQLADKWAKKNGIPVEPFYPEYEKYGPKGAPLRRNKEMAAKAHFFAAFPTKESRGTRHAIAQECVFIFEK